MTEKSKKDDANAQFAKIQRAQDAKKAMSDYKSEAAATRAKTERLRALRLARDAAVPAAPPAAAKKKSAKTKKIASPSLSEWLEGEKAGGRRS